MTTEISIKVTGLTELMDSTDKLIGSLPTISDEECQILAQWFETTIKRNALIMVPRIYQNSGKLVSSIKQSKIKDKHYIIEMVDYGKMLDKGSRPHKIIPKNAQILHWKRFGEDHYASVVKHPGNKPYLFLTSALLETNTQTKQFGYNISRRIKSFYKHEVI